MEIIAQKGPDKIKVEVLDDGSLKISTDKISAANHGSAELLINQLLHEAGGDVTRVKSSHHHHHHGHEDHVHE